MSEVVWKKQRLFQFAVYSGNLTPPSSFSGLTFYFVTPASSRLFDFSLECGGY